MPSLGLKLRLSNITSLIASVYTTGLQMWHKFTATTWTGSNRLPDSSPIGTNTAALYTGRGLSFDGINDVVTIGATGVTVKTVVFYAYPDSTTTAFMQLQSTGAVRIEISSGTLSATGFTTPTLYVNGAASSTVAATTWQQIAVTSATGVSASNVLLGQSNTTYYGGDLSNVKMFSVELSAGQIAELYANPEQALPTGVSSAELVGWWQLNTSNNVDIVPDASQTKNHGANSGATFVSSIPFSLPQSGVIPQNEYWIATNNNAYISMGDVAAFNFGTNDFTLMVSIDKVVLSGAYVYGLIGKHHYGSNDYALFLYDAASGNLRFTEGTNLHNVGTGVNLGTLRRATIFVRRVGTTLDFFVNGTKSTSGISANVNLSNALSFSLARYDASGNYLNNKVLVREAGVWVTGLTDQEIANITSGASTAGSIQSSFCKGWWKNKGKTSGDWADLSGNGNNGTVTGTVGSIKSNLGLSGNDTFGGAITRPNGGELILTGDGYAIITDAATLDTTTNITLEAWIKPFTVSADQTIIGKNNAYALNVTSGAKLQFSRWSSTVNGTVSSSASLIVNTWYHVAATYDGTTTIIYINGAQDTSSGAITGAIDATATDVLMGALTSSTNLFSGYLDSVKVYNQVLTAGQIAGNYNAERSAYS